MLLPELYSEALSYEHFEDTPENEDLIRTFTVRNHSGANLALFLQRYALKNEQSGENRTYLVKDKNTHELAGYFALRNGLFTIKIDEYRFFGVPAIELSDFAVNDTYRAAHPDAGKIGRTMFYDFVLPLARFCKQLTGIQALYIYALPEDRLIDHYASMGFERLDFEGEAFVHQHVKPDYDAGCIFMFQPL